MLAGLGSITPTPVSELFVTYGAGHHTVLLKHESHHPSGSVKERTALGLLRALDRQQPLEPGTVVVESTSGNLGIALARQLAVVGCTFIAVIDPKTPAATRRSLVAAGARLHLVDTDDGYGGYLLTRLEVVREMIRTHPDYRWTNQYDNPANPRIHAETTGPEILLQGGRDLDAVYVAVSTGGTLAGIASHIRGSGRRVAIVAVDAYNSMASRRPDEPAPVMSASARLLPGIGASRRSSFLDTSVIDRRYGVRDSEAIAMCRILREDTALGVGGSTGCVLSACVTELSGPTPPVRALCLAPDDAGKYEDTVYDDAWLAETGLLEPVRAAVERLRSAGLSFKTSEPVAAP